MVKFEIEDKNNFAEAKPRIKKGYYKGRFVEFVTGKQDGEPILTTFKNGTVSKLGIMKFVVLKEDGTPMKFKDGDTWYDVVLSYFINTEYKDGKTGEVTTGFTKKSRATIVFEHLGLKFNPENPVFDTDDYIGGLVELNIDDYEKNGVKFSIIKEVNKLEDDEENQPSKVIANNNLDIEIEDLSDNAKKQKDSLEKLYELKAITKEQYEKALAGLKK
jgi:hypothetical protein